MKRKIIEILKKVEEFVEKKLEKNLCKILVIIAIIFCLMAVKVVLSGKLLIGLFDLLFASFCLYKASKL